MDARRDVFEHAKKMWEAGLVVASAGNVSRRVDAARIAITPTGVPYESMSPDEIVLVDLESGHAVDSTREPSYELPMHLTIFRSHPEVQAIVHTHAPFVTTLSVLRRPLPPVIDEMVVHLGGTIEVAEYAFTGTDAVGTNVVRALGDRNGVLLANHGNVCTGRTLSEALHVAIVMEACARIYVQALALGEPVPLPNESIAAGRRMFEGKYRA
ncbi:MAG TPA: class II aldolase/adducin family protein [Thermoanaerobaculia bacterium]|nr:class II aldolase/adducin family protein [Thermoanaerobaculia bacterium]